MKPIVGQVVHYYDSMVENQNKPGPYAATVAASHSETCCTLAVLMPWRTDVVMASSVMREDAAGHEPIRYWKWPEG